MAVYNGERYVAEAVQSVLAQRFGDLELIVVDDGSTDRSATIVRELDDGRIRLLSNDVNVGLARSLNRGLADARGELVARLDADDVATLDRLDRQVEFFDANPAVALAGSWYTDLDFEGRATVHELPVEHWDLRWTLCLYCPFVHSAMMWRRTVVADHVGAYDEGLAYSMDFDLWVRIAARLRVANVPAPLVRIRSHPGSMTATFGVRTREGLRMRAAYAATLLGWDDAEESQEQRVDRLYRLHVSRPRRALGRQWVHGARDLYRLHRAFVAAEGVPSTVAARQRRAITTGLAWRLWRASIDAGARVVRR
jgi:glycosyltransferase involved in cell wall biosynthesis